MLIVCPNLEIESSYIYAMFPCIQPDLSKRSPSISNLSHNVPVVPYNTDFQGLSVSNRAFKLLNG